MATRRSSVLSTTAMIAVEDLEQDSDLTPRPKTPPPSPAVLLREDSDAIELQRSVDREDSEQRASSQTEGIFRRFIVEMDSRRRQCLRVQLAEPDSTSEHHRVSPTSSSSSSAFPSSSSSSSSDPAAAAAAEDDNDDELLS